MIYVSQQTVCLLGAVTIRQVSMVLMAIEHQLCIVLLEPIEGDTEKANKIKLRRNKLKETAILSNFLY
jgi:hypothetical protein